MSEVIFLASSLVIILAGAELFTNGVEWLGQKFNLGQGPVGSILAAVGTALPETLIPVIAILSGSSTEEAGSEIGIGAILGAPFMLSTLALFVVGTAVLIFRRNNKPLHINREVLMRDIRFFLILYTIAILASFLPTHNLKLVVIGILVSGYVYYVYVTFKTSEDADGEELAPCYFKRKSKSPSKLIIIFQIVVALLIIVGGAKIFINSVEIIAIRIGIPVFILAILITPIATELPEKFNSVIWVRKNKDTLALGNITGAMVFQSSLIPSLGIGLTSWVLEP
ncbi:MAG: sodium:calcium antiporter, partial [Eubacteriales bacterium]